MKNGENRYASDTQQIIAKLYRWASIIGLTFMAVIFALYVFGLLQTKIPVSEVGRYWHLDAERYHEETGTPTGWAFLTAISDGENLSFASLVAMVLSVIVCLLIMVVTFIKKRRLEFAIITFLQAVILVTAATGIISGG